METHIHHPIEGWMPNRTEIQMNKKSKLQAIQHYIILSYIILGAAMMKFMHVSHVYGPHMPVYTLNNILTSL